MRIIATDIPDVLTIEPQVFGDERGFFYESFNQKAWEKKTGLRTTFVQDNHSRSERNVLRGLHYQIRQPQGKLVRIVEGEVFDVAVDIRPGSPTFGRWVGFLLSCENFRQLYVPPGYAHGFCVTSERAQMEYKCTDLYYPEDEVVVLWSDPAIGIRWPLQGEAILSARDRAGKRLSELTDRLPKYSR